MEGCLGCFRGFFLDTGDAPLYNRLPSVTLDTQFMGENAVIVKSGHRLCGSGAALGTVPIAQNKAYFEMKLQQSGIWGVGIATRDTDLNRLPLGYDSTSCVLTHDGSIRSAGEIKHKIETTVQEGDIVGVCYDHIELRFFLNGNDLHASVPGVKAEEVYPVFYVDGGATVEATFNSFYHQPPSGFDHIMVEQSLL